MTKKQLENTHWLLLVSKANLKYAEQRKRWNELATEWRLKNKGLNKVPDHLGALLSFTAGIYQD
jgi:hypothetical protein